VTLVAGLDGCKAGWLIAACPPFRFAECRVWIEPSPEAALSMAADMAVIDIPIGLTDAQAMRRATDSAARTLLQAMNLDRHPSPGSRVFPAPSRTALALFRAGLDYHALNAQLTGPKMSQQAFHITGRIADVDAWMTPERQNTRREGHPEVAFARQAARTLPPKKTRGGAAARDAALRGLGFGIEGLAATLGKRTGRWAMDDLRDACILAWVASRVLSQTHTVLPALPETDALGLRMEIVA
jgi:predicted RNase H-like nuclease